MAAIFPAVAGVSSTCAAVAVIYRVVRPLFAVTVNCWFCGENSRVPYNKRNCWDCCKCDQYNGFTQDDDYNKPIPAQYDESCPLSYTQKASVAEFNSRSDVLCDSCSHNQLLKTRQLASFVPSNEARYDAEVSSYRRHLEHVYRLCRACDFRTQQVLESQARLLRKNHPPPPPPSPPREMLEDHSGDEAFLREDNNSDSTTRTSRFFATCAFLVVTFSFLADVCSVMAVVVVPTWLLNLLPSALLLLSGRLYPLLLIGFLALIVDVYRTDVNKMRIRDALALFFWLLLMAVHSSLVTMTTWSSLHSDALCATSAFVTALLCFWRVRHGRVTKQHAEVRTKTWKKIRQNGDSLHSSRSDISGDFTHSFVEDKIPLSCDATPAPQNKVPPLSIKKNDGHQGSCNGFPCFNQFETMNLGTTPTKKSPNTGGIFANLSAFGSLPATVPSPDVNSLRKRRPIISPARFKANSIRMPTTACKQSLFSKAMLPPVSSERTNLFGRAPMLPRVDLHRTGIDSSGAFTGGPIGGYAAGVGDRSSLFSEPRQSLIHDLSDEDDDNASVSGSDDSEICSASVMASHQLVRGTSAIATKDERSAQDSARCSQLNRYLLGFSVGINFILIAVYFLNISAYTS